MSVDILAEKFDLIREKLESGESGIKIDHETTDRTESITIDLDKIDEIVVVPNDQSLNSSLKIVDDDAMSSAKQNDEEEPYLFACKYLLPDIHQVSHFIMIFFFYLGHFQN